jgi:hypothetical protein
MYWHLLPQHVSNVIVYAPANYITIIASTNGIYEFIFLVYSISYVNIVLANSTLMLLLCKLILIDTSYHLFIIFYSENKGLIQSYGGSSVHSLFFFEVCPMFLVMKTHNLSSQRLEIFLS